jgi:hypothetical protein
MPPSIAGKGRGPMMQLLNSPGYWTPKLKIALLALATYLAMC